MSRISSRALLRHFVLFNHHRQTHRVSPFLRHYHHPLPNSSPSRSFTFFPYSPNSPHTRTLSSYPVSIDEILGLDSSTPDLSPPPSDSTSAAAYLYKTITDVAYTHTMEKTLDAAGLRLTPALVTETLDRLRYEEKTAFRFFMWAGQRDDYSHDTKSFNDMIDILTCTKHKTKQFRIVCDLLDYMKRTGKKSVPIEVLLEILRRYTAKYLTHVQKFSKKKRVRVKTQPEINAFNVLIDALCKCCLVEHAEWMFKRVKGKVKPDANTYSILFFGWCRVRNPGRGMRVLDEMIEAGFSPDGFTYTAAIDSFARCRMIEEAKGIFEFMKARGGSSTLSAPTAKTYSVMILALVKNDKMEDCFRVVEDMIKNGCLPDVSTYKELIEGMCLAGKVEEAYRFLEEMGKRGYPPDIVTYNCFLKVLCDNEKREEAMELYRRIFDEKAGCQPSVQTFNMLIRMFFSVEEPDAAVEAWREMDARGCHRGIDTYCVMIEGLYECDRTDDACLLLEEVVNKGMKLPYQKFDSFLAKLSETGNLRGIHTLSEHMRRSYNPAMARRFAVGDKRKNRSLRGR